MYLTKHTKYTEYLAPPPNTLNTYFPCRAAARKHTGQNLWRAATLKNTPLAFVQAGPMDPWAPMQKALLDALVLH